FVDLPPYELSGGLELHPTIAAVRLPPVDHDSDFGRLHRRCSPARAVRCCFCSMVGDSQAWYGQMVDFGQQTLPENSKLRRTSGVTIGKILRLLSPLDYLQLDVQGVELNVLSYQPDRLDREVRLVNIGTHSAEIEAGLRKLFRQLGWQCLYDIK